MLWAFSKFYYLPIFPFLSRLDCQAQPKDFGESAAGAAGSDTFGLSAGGKYFTACCGRAAAASANLNSSFDRR